MNQALEHIVSKELDALGFDLVELRRGGTSRRPVLDLRIDRRDGDGVTVDDCALASRAIEPLLESSGLVAEQYVLEVSSPGVERPLRVPADWRRFSGRTASVLSPAVGGRIEAEVLGLEEEEGVEIAVLRDGRGIEHRIPLADVRDARLVFRWDR